MINELPMLRTLDFQQKWPKASYFLFHLPVIPDPRPTHSDEETLGRSPSESSSESFLRSPSLESIATCPSPQQVPSQLKGPKWYPGEPLPSSTSIRLVKIHETHSEGSSISLILQTFDLAASPRFRALSYTWGSPVRAVGKQDDPYSVERDREILCNDETIWVTPNLLDALAELRESGFADWLWVDAICINQSDHGERASQVSLMGQIYKSAVETIAWLGQDEDGTEDVQWAIDVMIPAMLQRGASFWDSRPLKHPELESIFGVDDLNDRLIRIKEFLSTRRWFGRAWTAQEIVLAPAVRVRVGKRLISWTDLTNLSIALTRVSWDQELVPRSPDLDQGYSTAKSFLTNLYRLRGLVSRKHSKEASRPSSGFLEVHRSLEATYSPRTDLEEAGAWLSFFLSLVRALDSSEARDKVYSIMGVAALFSSKIDELVKLDYTQPVEEVYRSTTAALIRHSRYLNVLGMRGDLGDSTLENLPSWVVDYSCRKSTNAILEFGKGQSAHLDASLASKLPSLPREIERTRLTLTGARFDRISSVSPATLGNVIESVALFEGFMHFVSRLPERYFDGQTRADLLWRVMMMDSEETTDSTTHPAPSSFAPQFRAWIIHQIGLWVADIVNKGTLSVAAANQTAQRFFVTLYSNTPIEVPKEYDESDESFDLYHRTQMLPFLQATIPKVNGRKLFRTRNKFVGLASRSVQAGDQVWLIRDARTPLILRPTLQEGEFLLVGEAYLHGFMRGEMFDRRWNLEERIGPLTIV